MALLEDLDQNIRDFIWSRTKEVKRAKVDYITITRTKEGGLGLISFKRQTQAMVGKAILWAAHEGETTLQCIIREKIADLLERRWGYKDYSWLVSLDFTKPMDESTLWTNFALTWIELKKEIVLVAPANWESRLTMSLWTPHLVHKTRAQVGCKQIRQRTL